ncbi:MAG: glycosyltransferase family 2 protein [Microgenomates group bacterium]|nr:glycosyltransferase family 2 protein [Candidatus Woesebacteria bacterium]MBP6883552.1 glycosyltransferase family 2 protein [Candidatus Woesebacteria bacterium]QQR63411.1 MAG: glycosyltransferase family 2 protein [Candidatus Roizmanbacteria bacterium]
MKHRLSVIMVTRNADELLFQSIKSVKDIADEIVVVDAGSTDRTLSILKSFNINPIATRLNHLGKNKSKALSRATGDLVLALDSDEIVSPSLIRTIKSLKRRKILADGYIIPFRNHFLGRRLRYGGENYRMLRLAKRRKVNIKNVSVHESLVLNSKHFVNLGSPIMHYSYRTLHQMYGKFTTYALNEATERYKKGEQSSFKKVTFYPVHMFWARLIQDKGYKDGFFRLPLDLGFAYMEFLTYSSLAIKNLKK